MLKNKQEYFFVKIAKLIHPQKRKYDPSEP